MSDIYNALATSSRLLGHHSTETLADYRDSLDDAEIAVNRALHLIGNLILEAEQSDCYSDKESRRDLVAIGSVLRNLPRLAQALNYNSKEIEYELKRRKGVSQ
ncbi:hypothetical protein [Rosenbergiella nectarea]|uniref:hypothetical protein n=1 Tax=Rosenbergiella nectarea TaxID=988801 RepID=UPI001F4E8EFE|nr:hypothetical protein [Rosenbergiella nectarea]